MSDIQEMIRNRPNPTIAIKETKKSTVMQDNRQSPDPNETRWNNPNGGFVWTCNGYSPISEVEPSSSFGFTSYGPPLSAKLRIFDGINKNA
jgi:hypothetical protein